MADNIRLNQTSGSGDIIAAHDHGGVKRLIVEVGMDDSPARDAFARFRVSEPHTVFDSKLLAADNSPLFWDEELETGAGITASTPTAAKPYIDFTSTINQAGKFTRQTLRRFHYQPGKGQLVIMTGVLELSGGGDGVERRIGLFDDDNGLFFESNEGVIGVTVRSNDTGSPVDTTVAQANWNLDTLDGNDDEENGSGITADFSKAQLLVIDYQWLSTGRVRFGVEIGGQVIYVHEVKHANILSTPYMSTPNLPLRYQMITTGTSPASAMRVICGAVIAEGGQDPTGINHSHATVDHVNANTENTVYALLGIRLKAALVGCDVEPLRLSVVAETKDQFEWQLIYNATVAGTFNYADKTNSCVQTATGDSSANPSTNTVSGGTVVAQGFVSEKGAETIGARRNGLRLGVKIDGTVDTLVLAVRPLSANADIQGALTWQELL